MQIDGGRRRARLAGAAAAVGAVILAGCSGSTGDRAPSPTDRPTGQQADALPAAADDLAAALETGELSGVAWAGLSPEDLSSLGGLAGLPRTVDVVEVGDPVQADGAGEVAEVVLRWSWDVTGDDEEDWTYTTTAELSRGGNGATAGDVWAARDDGAMLAEGLEEGAELVLGRTPAERGEVLAADGTPVVTARPVLRVGLDKTRLPEGFTEEQLRAAAGEVAEQVGLADPDAFAEQVLAAGPRAFVEAIVVREGSDVVSVPEVEAVPGGAAIAASLPLAPTSTWARPVLGSVGQATAEIVEASEGQVRPGDLVGLAGLQRTYDEHLRGTPGVTVTAGSQVLFEQPPVPGEDLQLTLDTDLQTAAEEALADTETAAGLVAIRASTGEVLAAASGPGSEGRSTATEAALAPGSTFKMVSALALLRAGVGPEDTLSCTPEARASGYPIGNYPGYPEAYLGDITVSDAIAQSCNTALVNARDQLSPAALTEAATALGVAQPVTGDWEWFSGAVPAEGSDTELAAMLIGQGEVLASPMAMATVAASIDAGRQVTPVLVRGPGDGAEPPEGQAAPHPLTADEAQTLRDYMRGVVTEGGGQRLADLPGEPVHAKTGSAEAGEVGGLRVDSWMIAFQGDLAVAALVHSGGYGSEAAGGVVEEFLRTAGTSTVTEK